MAVAPSSSSSLNLFIAGLVFLLAVPRLFLHVSCKARFSAELMHRDSPKSHPASTPLSRLNSSIRRSPSYDDYLRTADPGNVNSLLVRINNEGGIAKPGNANSLPRKRGASALITSYYSHYVVSFKIGLNGHNVSAVLEVADDFTWLFCDPCPTCNAEHIFDPSKSGTYEKLNCNHKYCDLFEERDCDDPLMCRFSHKYYPGTANGILSKERVYIRSTEDRKDVFLENIIFGCTNAISLIGEHFEHSMGVLGLGSGELSFVSQLLESYAKKFSYCLPKNYGSRSYLKFGIAANVEGTMLIAALDSSQPPFHKITLTGIYVGSTGGHTHSTFHNIVISTSILRTHIDMDSLKFIREQVMQRVTLPPAAYPGYDLCYNTHGATVNFKMPNINLIFWDNAQLILEEDNAFVRVENNVLCLAIRSNERTSGTSVLGSLAQRGYLMLFDVNKGKLRFTRKLC